MNSQDLYIRDGVTIPASELSFRSARASGPGGQHVNKSNTKVQLTWTPSHSAALTEEQRALILRYASALAMGAVQTDEALDLTPAVRTTPEDSAVLVLRPNVLEAGTEACSTISAVTGLLVITQGSGRRHFLRVIARAAHPAV